MVSVLPLGLVHFLELIVGCCVLFQCLLVVASCSVVGFYCRCSFGCFFVYFVFPIFLVVCQICRLLHSALFSCKCYILCFSQGSCPLMKLYLHFQQSGILLLFGGVGSMLLLAVCCVRCIRLIPDPFGFCACVLLMRC